MTETRLLADENCWIEGDAVRQLEASARLEGMELAVGLPDLHPGKGGPVGAAFLNSSRVYPALVGNDIGCGMGAWLTDVKAKKLKIDRWVPRLSILEEPEGDGGLGTVGRGNHFAELCVVDEVVSDELGVDKARCVLIVHSGSRGLGEAILRAHVAEHAGDGVDADSDDARDYLARHDEAVAWAEENRRVIARRFLDAIGGDGERALDLCHNFVEARDEGWLHRKGAAPSDRGPVVLPGSRGARSWLLAPTAEAGEACAWSLAHGAGRRWKRSECAGRLKKKYSSSKQLERTKIGGRVICEDKALLYEEAPEAYKDVEVVVSALERRGLVRRLAALRPVLTFKTVRR
jgi:release factor H-coupled RctB family protein